MGYFLARIILAVHTKTVVLMETISYYCCVLESGVYVSCSCMRGSRKFCQRGSNTDVFFLFLFFN